MDVIMTSYLYQAPLVQDDWVFQRKFDSIDALVINFWLDHIDHFELTQVMHEIDGQFIEILNKF
jgi:hypothetical protein